MNTPQDLFQRTELLLGQDFLQKISEIKVVLFGVGGVGSWCAESLLRTGVKHLTIVDSDFISASNINRQLPATTENIGQPKVEVLKKRLLEINPNAEIVALQQLFCAKTADFFQLETYDYIIDAIDSLENKALLIRAACLTKAKLFSSMGAALKIDPLKIQIAEFWKVKGCGLAASLRRKFKKSQSFPSKKFLCVFSDEYLENRGQPIETEKNQFHKVQTNGTVAHATAIFGFMLAGLLVQDIKNNNNK
jgi:tRNA A37 threonylcarbamoyladenosine dehydratase